MKMQILIPHVWGSVQGCAVLMSPQSMLIGPCTQSARHGFSSLSVCALMIGLQSAPLSYPTVSSCVRACACLTPSPLA